MNIDYGNKKVVDEMTSLLQENEDPLQTPKQVPWKGLENALFLKEKHYHKRVNYETITHISSDGAYLEIHTDDAVKKHIVRGSLNKIIHQLPDEFVRIHRGYIINLNHLIKINSINVVLTKNIEVHISKQFRNQLLKAIHTL